MADVNAEPELPELAAENGDTDVLEASDGAAQVPQESDDEYDPSALVPDTTTYEEQTAPLIRSPATDPASQIPSRSESRVSNSKSTQAAATASKPRTIGAFAVDDSSDEDGLPVSVVNPAASVTNGQNSVAQAASQPATDNAELQAPIPAAPFPDVSLNTSAQDQHASAAATPVPSSLLPSASVAPDPTNASAKTSPSIPQPSQAVVSAKSARPARLPNDRIGILEDRIEEDPRGDTEAWLQLIAEHRARGRLDEARAAYDRFFKVFPHAADEWVNLIKMEMDAEEMGRAEQHFHKSLMQVPHVKLWSTYLDYVRRRYNLTTDVEGKARQTIAQTFDIVLQNVGMDRNAGQLWTDYIDFLKSGPGTVGGSTWQDGQKVDVLRKAYHRAVIVPTHNTNAIWNDYNRFEMDLNKATGRKFLQEKSPAFVTARSSAVYMANTLRDLDRTTMPRLPPAPGFEGEEEYLRQVDIWKAWIEWEKSDPLEDKDTDPATYRARVLFTYKQALMALRFWAEMWYSAAEWCFENGMETEGNNFLLQGIEANPESLLLAFKRADRIELSSATEEGEDTARKRGEAVKEPYNKLLEALYELVRKIKERGDEDLARTSSRLAQQAAAEDQVGGGDEDDDDQANDDNGAKEQAKQRQAVRELQLSTIKTVYNAQIDEMKKLITTAWISLMRAMRRVQGKGKPNDPTTVGGSRQVFADCRKKGNLTSEIYVAAALLEHYAYKEPAGTKIFERGVKLFPEDEHLVLEYLKHLIAINDITNARAVFEATVARLAAKPALLPRAKPLYVFFHTYESQYGELLQIQKLEKRMADLFPDDPNLSLYRTFETRFVSSSFNPMIARPIVSPKTQARPKALLPVLPTVEPVPRASVERSPRVGILPFTNSPKRPLEHSFEAEPERPRKLARGESPLAGAAGRRLAASKHAATPSGSNAYGLPGTYGGFPVPKPLPREVNILLSIIPGADRYDIARFNPSRMVDLLRSVDLNRANLNRPPGT